MKINSTTLREIMRLAWQFVKRNGFTMSEALRAAWLNIKLLFAFKQRIVKFYYQKVDSTLREAYGTFSPAIMPEISGNDRRAKNDTVQIYYDTERQEFRCFKKANLIKICV
ncbi:MAG: SH3 beta-barrel fold-containing protein [Dysgonamonadaceae bacterium]|jgi:hypothetical protein|nr:SH3 beta-barrel fold-containing protein [Dysgonamonadaceae bacterium]